MYTEIVIKNNFWTYFKKQKAVVQGTAVIHRAVASAEPLSYTIATTVVEAPQDKLRSNRVSNADLREPLLESAAGATSL